MLLVFNQLLLNGLQGQGLGSAHIGSTDKTLTLLTSSESLHCYLCTLLHWHIALLDQQHCIWGSFVLLDLYSGVVVVTVELVVLVVNR